MKKILLQQYLFLKKEIALLEVEHQDLVCGQIMSSRISGLPSSGRTVDFTGDYACKIYELTSLIANKLNDLVSLRLEIESWIDLLEPHLRLLLRMVYIEGKNWDEVSIVMCYSRRHLQRLHNEALEILDNY